MFCISTAAVNGQECTDAIGSLDHDSIIVPQGRTFILAGYTVPCDGTVVAWEFCYRRADRLVAFSPGIWRINETTGSDTDFELVQSNNITYNASMQTTSVDFCQRVNLSSTDQFTAPAGSVVGVYSGTGPQLLHTNNDSLITAYIFVGNKSRANINNNNINYNITIKVHFGKIL